MGFPICSGRGKAHGKRRQTIAPPRAPGSGLGSGPLAVDARGPRGKDFTAVLETGPATPMGGDHRAALGTGRRGRPGAVLTGRGETVSRAAWASGPAGAAGRLGAEGPAGSMSARCFPAAGGPLWRNQADGFPLPGKRTEALQTASLPPGHNSELL